MNFLPVAKGNFISPRHGLAGVMKNKFFFFSLQLLNHGLENRNCLENSIPSTFDS